MWSVDSQENTLKCGVRKYYIGPIGDLSLLTATAAAVAYTVCIESLQ